MSAHLPFDESLSLRFEQIVGIQAKMLLAISGGVDSMVLCDFILAQKERLSLTLLICHVHHGIRGEEADRDAAFVRAYCEDQQLPYQIVYCDVPAYAFKHKLSIETAARKLRYDALTTIADAMGESVLIVTAHHQQDQVETIFDRFLRGTGSKGLRGMNLLRDVGKHRLYRPFLDVNKKEIMAYARQRGIDFQEDSSNTDLMYRRNRLRHETLPQLRAMYNENLDTTIVRMAEILRDEDEYLDQLTQQVIQTHFFLREDHAFCSIERFAALPYALQRRCIKLVLEYLDHREKVDFEHIEGVRFLIAHRSGTSFDVGGGLRAWREHDWHYIVSPTFVQRLNEAWEPMTLGKSSFFFLPQKKWEIRTDKQPFPRGQKHSLWEAWFSLPCDEELCLRPTQEGDRIEPLGMMGSKLLSDLFIDAKLPKHRRIHYPVITFNGKILWVPGFVRSRHQLVGEDGEQSVVHVSIIPIEES